MHLKKILFTLVFAVGFTAFGASPKGFAPSSKRLTKAEIAARGLDVRVTIPQGYYVSEDGDLSFSITKTGYLKTDFGVQLVSGTKAPLDFPRKLRFIESEEVYRTKGETAVSWYTTLGVLTCRYPVSFEFTDLNADGEKLRMRATIPQSMGIDAWGRCINFGTRYITARFVRE